MRLQVWILLVSTLALAADAPLRLIALDGGLGDGVPAVVERVLGEDAEIHIVLLRAPSVVGEVKLSANLMLSGDAIAAPLQAGFAFKPAAKATHPALLEGSLTLPQPDTAKAITQIVTLHQGHADTANSKVASFTMRWVSAEECKNALSQAVVEDAAGRGCQLAVCGSLPGLRERLRTWKVPFEDHGKDLPARVNGETILIANDVPEDEKLPSLADGASLLLFRSRAGRGHEVLRKDGRVRFTEVFLQGTPDWQHSALLLRLLTDHLKPATPVPAP